MRARLGGVDRGIVSIADSAVAADGTCDLTAPDSFPVINSAALTDR